VIAIAALVRTVDYTHRIGGDCEPGHRPSFIDAQITIVLSNLAKAILLESRQYSLHVSYPSIQATAHGEKWNFAHQQITQNLRLENLPVCLAGSIPGVVVGNVGLAKENQIVPPAQPSAKPTSLGVAVPW
jgi:hypothetical protein